MGLSLQVGLEADGYDNQFALEYSSDLAKLNDLLLATGLSKHDEPIPFPKDDLCSIDMIGYSGLHYLRRLAVYLEAGLEIPAPGPPYEIGLEADAEYDKLNASYERRFLNHGNFVRRKPKNRFLSKLFDRGNSHRGEEPYLPFSHLVMHGDADGVYVPQSFNAVRLFDEESRTLGLIVGSSQKLLEECRKIAAAIELPLDLDLNSDEILDAIDMQGVESAGWRRYGIEAYTCLALIRVCEASIAMKAALIFSWPIVGRAPFSSTLSARAIISPA
jgi:hypothetical protein